MPYYDVTIFEVFTQKFRVKADTPAEAVKLTENRDNVCMEGGAEYLEEASEYGTPIREIARELKIPFDQLRAQLEAEEIGLDGDDDPETVFIPAIKDIELSGDQDD